MSRGAVNALSKTARFDSIRAGPIRISLTLSQEAHHRDSYKGVDVMEIIIYPIAAIIIFGAILLSDMFDGSI